MVNIKERQYFFLSLFHIVGERGNKKVQQTIANLDTRKKFFLRRHMCVLHYPNV